MSEEEMNKIIKGKTHYYENDILTTGTFKIGETGTFPNAITTTYSLSRVYDTEEIENIINENTKLKQDDKKQTKTYQKILQEMQREIDHLQRNCDVFNEQMNDAVVRATELQKQLQAYKDKEDKIIHKIQLWQMDGEITIRDLQEILQILNEGGK